MIFLFDAANFRQYFDASNFFLWIFQKLAKCIVSANYNTQYLFYPRMGECVDKFWGKFVEWQTTRNMNAFDV